MSTSSQASLGALRLQAQQRTGMENNNAITTSEWNQYASQSYKELYDLLISAYGNDYYVATQYQFNVTSNQQYPLPNGTPTYRNVNGTTAQKFYKLLGVDLQYNASPSGWVTIKRFEFIERNKYLYPNTATNFNGYTNMRYRISGDNIFLIPIPSSGQLVQLWYAPAPTSLQFMLPCGTSTGSTSVTLSDTTGLSTGMNVSGLGVQPNSTISTLTSTSFTLSLPATSGNASSILSMWNDNTVMEGIAGWEEYIVLDMAIKCQIKQEFDFTGFAGQKQAMMARIEAMAEGRDIGQAHHVSDVLSVNCYGGDGWNGGGWDGGGF